MSSVKTNFMYQLTKHHYETIPSTQDVAKTLVPTLKENEWILVTADEQTKARGTHGRPWFAPIDVNIYATFAFCLAKDKEHLLFYIPQVTALSICQTLHSLGFDPRLKWVNDVLINRKKVSGVLCESEIYMQDTQKVIGICAGFGINVNMTKTNCDALDQPATSLMVEGNGQIFNKNEILNILQLKYMNNIALLIASGFAAFSEKISEIMAFIAEDIQVSQDGNDIIKEGIMRGVDVEGRLLLETAQGLERLRSGRILRNTTDIELIKE